MARAMWKGVITFDDVSVPVKLYSAVKQQGVHFRLLHEKDLEPVRQEMVNPETGEVVPYEEVHRAFETESGDFVLLDEEELDELEPEASRDIEITRFVPAGAITHMWYERPYFLGPDEGGATGYWALVEALRRREREGLARWVMRKKEYVGALRPEGDHLMLITLRHAGEVIDVSSLKAPAGRDLDEKEVRMAKQLVSALEGEFDPTEFRDEYRDRVLELVEAKAAGRVVKFPKAPKKKTGESLSKMLEQSIAAAKKKTA